MSQNARRAVGALIAVFAGSALPVATAADVVLDWNQQLLSAVAATSTSPPMASRAMAMVHTAVYDAVNSVNPTHRGYLAVYPTLAGTSADAAAAQAARDVLAALYPSRAAIFDAQLAQSLAAIPDSPGKAAGLALGAHAASQTLGLAPTTTPLWWFRTRRAHSPAGGVQPRRAMAPHSSPTGPSSPHSPCHRVRSSGPPPCHRSPARNTPTPTTR